MNIPQRYSNPAVPSWFIDLHYEGCPYNQIADAYNEYLDYRDEGYSTHYILVNVLGLKDSSY